MNTFETYCAAFGLIVAAGIVAATCYWVVSSLVRAVIWLIKRHQKQAIYWNEDEQQIKIRSGKCIFDKRVMNKLCADAQRVRDNGDEIEEYNRTVEEENEDITKRLDKLEKAFKKIAKKK